MLLRTKLKLLREYVYDNFQGVADDIIHIDRSHHRLEKAHNALARDYARLKKHISSNGLWRTVKELRARIDEMHLYQTNMAQILNDLNTNGVATAINKLNDEVFGKSKQTGSTIERVMLSMNGVEPREVPTLAAKVDAIIEHLGIEVNVEPEKVVKTPAKITAKKVKKTTKKGRR